MYRCGIGLQLETRHISKLDFTFKLVHKSVFMVIVEIMNLGYNMHAITGGIFKCRRKKSIVIIKKEIGPT